jgi:hypothetical protein
VVFSGRIFLVIEIVNESDEAPHFLVFAELASVGTQARFHRKRMFAKTF